MLRRSLQNYTKVKAASSQSRGSSDFASCKENTPVTSDAGSQAEVHQASGQQPSDRTPTSRFHRSSAGTQSPKPLAEIQDLTVCCCLACPFAAHVSVCEVKTEWYLSCSPSQSASVLTLQEGR